ncbi:alpha/beta fold hydrolase [Pseudonocardiaceae bacterium YIM PH 21723]|nr:alpha/beta fold hydrolase [Pseudonocardiaceae bacterium YIM PH 21723]
MPIASTPAGLGIHYETQGSGEPLLLLGGQANTLHWWDSVLPDFAADHQVITVDYAGTGASDKPRAMQYSTRGMAGDMIAVLDALEIDRAHVYGMSLGGRIAQWLAADHPGRVAGLVLGCTSPGAPNGIERTDEVTRAMAAADPREALIDLMYTPAWPGPYNALGDPDMPLYARRQHFTASVEHNGWDALLTITSPTLVVHGTDDLINPTANAPLLAGRIRGARLELIRGARHAYHEEFRSVASPLVAGFLSQNVRIPD